MSFYRKKPVVIEAFQWTGGPDQLEDPAWIVEALHAGQVWLTLAGTPDVLMHVRTLEGVVQAVPGDWIIKGVKGELYPCKPDIFAMTYSAVDTPTAQDVAYNVAHVAAWCDKHGISLAASGELGDILEGKEP